MSASIKSHWKKVTFTALAIWAALATTAEAGPSRYVFEKCDSVLPGGGVDGIHPVGHPRFGFTFENSCAEPGGGLIIRLPALPENDGGDAAWAVPIAAPRGATVDSVTVTAASCAPAPSYADVLSSGWPPTCNPVPDVRTFAAGEDFGGVSLRVGCLDQPQPGSQCAAGPWVAARAFAATIVDRSAPEVAEPEGTLLAPGERRGRQRIAVSASDEGGGLAGFSVLVNGTAAAPPRRPACALVQADNKSVTGLVATRPAPCPDRASAEWMLDTGSHPFHDGLNVVKACAWDFATLSDPNVSCSSPRNVFVENSCSESAVGGGEQLGARFAGSRARALTIRHGLARKIVGTLSGAGGQPLRGARLCVFSQTIGIEERPAPIGSVLTDTQGRYSFLLSPGPNREITIAYRDDATLLARGLRLFSRARSSLQVSAPRATNGEQVRFRGRLAGPAAGGRVVVLQAGAVGSRRWLTFRRATADTHGVFRASYRFKATTGRIRYRFRALIPRQAGYPWAQGQSRSVEVLVGG